MLPMSVSRVHGSLPAIHRSLVRSAPNHLENHKQPSSFRNTKGTVETRKFKLDTNE